MIPILTNILQIILLILLIICSISVAFLKNNLVSVVVFMSYSTIMSIIWILLEAPDLAITEAAVGAGITSILFFITLKKIHQIDSSLNTIKNKKGDHSNEKE